MPDLIPSAPAGDDRAAMIAEMRALTDGPAETAVPVAEEKKTDGRDDNARSGKDPQEEVSEDAEETADAVEEEPEAEEEEAEEPDPETEEEVDPDTAKRLQQVQKAERRAREAMAAERREFDAERERWRDETKETRAALERFEKMKSRAKLNLAEVAKELGVPEEDFEHHAEQLYRRSPKGLKDPRNKAMADQTVREREQAARLEQLEKQIEDDRKAREQERATVEQQKAADAFLDTAQKTITDKTPIVKYLHTKDPGRAREKLRVTAAKMIRETGEVPKHAAVVAELEKTERAKWKRLGIDIPGASGTTSASTPLPKKGDPKKKHPGAGETTRPQPKNGVQSSERPVPKTPEQERQEIVRAMREGNLE